MATAPRTISELVFPQPQTRAQALGRDAALILLGAALVAGFAQITIHLPFVPLTGQTLAVLLVGASLGWRRGALALLTYVAGGAAGLPIYAEHKAGLVVLAGPTGGYLIGFIVAAAIVGFLAERGWDRTPMLTTMAMIIGNVVIYAFGAGWLAYYFATHLAKLFPTVSAALQGAYTIGVQPFLLGDAIKIAIAVVALPIAHQLLSRRTPTA